MALSGASQMARVIKNPPANAGDARDTGSVPGSGRSPGGGHGNPFQYSSHGQRSLVGYSPWKSWTQLKRLIRMHVVLSVPSVPSTESWWTTSSLSTCSPDHHERINAQCVFTAGMPFWLSLRISYGHHSYDYTFYLFIYLFFKLYIIVLVLPNTKMNPPQVYMCSPSWTLLPPPSLFHPSGS